MVRAYVLIETTSEKTGAVLGAVGHGLMNCLALGHSFRSSEVVAHLECTELNDLVRAVTDDLAGRDGVLRVGPLQIINGE